MNKTFSFNKQLKLGNKGEVFFKKCYKSRICIKSDLDLRYDILIDKSKTVELKTDYWPLSKTSNFFMEYYGNEEKKKLGGPWRSLQDNIDFFVYCFVNDKTFYWFETKKLCKILDKHLDKFAARKIHNKTWNSLGYLVPIKFCEPHAITIDKF